MTSNNNNANRPLVSVVLAVYNEARHIDKCMNSLRTQDTPDFDLEILAIDGASNDGTREYLEQVAAEDRRVRVLLNEKRRAPFAFNIGIREARGAYICIFGSHTIYAKDYISVSFRELIGKDAGGCGGRIFVQPGSGGLQARLAAYAFAHPFGSSRKSFRTQPEGYVDTVGYMIIKREALLQAGGYSETLLRNQDNDTNQRMRALGHKLYCTWKTHCFYQPKQTIRDLLMYAYQNGFWNVISLKENPSSMGARHFIPFLFVLGLLSTLLVGGIGFFLPVPYARLCAIPFAAVVLLHLTLGIIASMGVAWRNKDLGAVLLPGVFLGFHVAYGLGTLVAFVTGARAPQPSPQPTGAAPRFGKLTS